MMKNPFGIVPINSFCVIYKSYRQVLTSIHNSQLLSKLPILGKFRLATFKCNKRNYSIKTGMNQFRRNKSSRDLDSSCAI
jgi:hypothetical protein